MIMESQTLIGRGVYTYREAATLAGLKRSRVREWFSLRASAKSEPIFQSDFAGRTSQQLISFLDLVDVFIAGQLRDAGISLQTLKLVFKTLQKDLGVEHPFGRRELLTDGRSVFLAGLDPRGKKEVIEVLSGQKAFPQIILPFLKKLNFDSTSRLANKWNIAKGVVVNPGICFGQPIVEAKGIPTHLIAKAVVANGNDIQAVADWYEMTTGQVSYAVQFEQKLAA